MPDMKRGDDAADHAPKPEAHEQGQRPLKPPKDKQDAKNYPTRDDGAEAIEREDVSSANDE